MATPRIVQAFMGYFIPFALIIAFFFFLEIFLELLAGILARIFMVQLATKPDFPGPLNLLNWGISAFPSIWDIGTVLFWGGIEEIAFLLMVVSAILAGLTGAAAFIRIRDAFSKISSDAGAKSKVVSRIQTFEKIKP